MEKISVTIDLTKIDKTRIVERKYLNADGTEGVAKEYKVDVVPLKQVKVIKSTPQYTMIKKYFVVQAQTKEERVAKAPSIFVGDGIVFEYPNDTQASTGLTDSDQPF